MKIKDRFGFGPVANAFAIASSVTVPDPSSSAPLLMTSPGWLFGQRLPPVPPAPVLGPAPAPARPAGGAPGVAGAPAAGAAPAAAPAAARPAPPARGAAV